MGIDVRRPPRTVAHYRYGSPGPRAMRDKTVVAWVKTVHSVIFLFMATCCLYVLYSGIVATWTVLTDIAIGVIVFEGVVLLVNKGQCPLATLAREHGDPTGTVVDIFFPRCARLAIPSLTVLFFVGLGLLLLR